jgi:Cellulose biosynthesis protein BcsS
MRRRGGFEVRYSKVRVRLVVSAAIVMGAASALCPRANAADMLTKAPPAAASPSDVNSSVLWLGGDFKNDVDAGNIGGIYALSGNLDAPGWLVRGQFTYVNYDFNSPFSPTGSARGQFYEGSAAIGYQWTGNGFVASGLVGPDYENYNINPAAAATPGIGDRLGAAFFGRVATMGGAQFPSAIDGDFSTANNSYWVRGRTGARFGSLTLGPEAIALGNKVYDEVRGGGYASYDLSRNVILQGDLGYADATRGANTSGGRGGSGVYGGVTLIFLH